jgi:hypothetical protein
LSFDLEWRDVFCLQVAGKEVMNGLKIMHRRWHKAPKSVARKLSGLTQDWGGNLGEVAQILPYGAPKLKFYN